MKPRMTAKLGTDIGMMLALLLLMTYERIGSAAHEWLGIGVCALFIVHHILNRKWLLALTKGKYTVLRVWQALLVVLALVTMAGSMISGILISRHALRFLPVRGGRAFGRSLHMLSAYWGFAALGLHLGFHWQMLMGTVRQTGEGGRTQSPCTVCLWRGAAVLTAAYGLYAFFRRGIPDYLFLITHFVFFDYEEPLAFFLLDYAAILGLFVFLGHYTTALLKHISRTGKKK